MPSYELVYFDVRGRAELARCVFAAAGQSYKDTRLTGEQWAAQKGDTQYGQLPELKIDGKALCQSNSIARFLAREFGLAGKDNFEVGKVDMYVDLCNDLLEQFVKAVFEKDEAKKSELDKKLNDETVPKFMGFFERDLKNNGGKFLVGSSLTLADLAVQTVFDTLLQKEPGAMDKHPLLKAHREALRAAPKIGDYLKNRKTTDI